MRYECIKLSYLAAYIYQWTCALLTRSLTYHCVHMQKKKPLRSKEMAMDLYDLNCLEEFCDPKSDAKVFFTYSTCSTIFLFWHFVGNACKSATVVSFGVLFPLEMFSAMYGRIWHFIQCLFLSGWSGNQSLIFHIYQRNSGWVCCCVCGLVGRGGGDEMENLLTDGAFDATCLGPDWLEGWHDCIVISGDCQYS